MTKTQKLELTWTGKANRSRLEPRILIDRPDLSYAAKGNETSSNQLIQGDNLLALKALERDFAGKVRCVFIDPPYNTGSAFEHYDDGLEHSIWLGMMRDRLERIRTLMRPDGSLWMTLDDNEVHYGKVLCDEVFGRSNFIIQNTIRRSAPTGHKAINPTPVQVADYLLVYARDRSKWTYKPQYVERGFDIAYNRYIERFEDGPEHWTTITLNAALKRLGVTRDEALQRFPDRIIRFAQPNIQAVGAETRALIAASKRCPEQVFVQQRTGRPDIHLLAGNRILFYKDKLHEIGGRLVTGELLTNVWSDIPYQGIANEGAVVFPKGKKPEKLLQRVIEIATDPGDLVLDSFAGSGTTGAVAHKMRRRWIMVEIGEQASTHIVPRLRRVLDGVDQGGVSVANNWTGGGGFTFQTLAPSLIERDRWGNEIISTQYDEAMLARAICNLEGFTFAPSESEWWRHGHSSEHDLIYVTRRALTHNQLCDLSHEVGSERTLLVLCAAWCGSTGEFGNLTIKKILDQVRGRFEPDRERDVAPATLRVEPTD